MKTLLILIAFFAQVAAADWSSIPSTDFEMADYPAEGSKASNRDFEILLKYQASRTTKQCALAGKQRHPSFAIFFSHTEILDADEYEKSKELLEQVAQFSERVANYFKGQFERPRPYDTDKRIKPCIAKVEGAKAYPSSHSVVALASSCILAEIFPAKSDDLEQYGHELGELRAVVGVHHPSDVKAGQKLAMDICERLKSEPDFKKELKALRR